LTLSFVINRLKVVAQRPDKFNGIDRIRSGDADCDLSLSTKFGGRYQAYTGGDIIPKMFTNCRSSWVCDLVNVFGFQQHEAATYIGHTKAIQEEHYLRIMEDEHSEALANWADLKKSPLCNTSYLYHMLITALQNNLPELVPAAEKHATRITKIGKKAMFRNQEVDATSSNPLILSGAKSSGGGTRICGRFLGKELHSLQSWGQTGDNFGQREVLISDPPRFKEAGNPIQTPHPLFGVPRI
jgi:hypothetical protein